MVDGDRDNFNTTVDLSAAIERFGTAAVSRRRVDSGSVYWDASSPGFGRVRSSHWERTLALSSIAVLHDRLATSVLLFMVAVGVWGLWSFARGGSLSGSLAGAMAIGQALIAVQIVAGVALYIAGDRPTTAVHYLYGLTALLVLPFMWTYFRDRDQRQALLIYSLVTLFVAGLAVRGMTTGS